MDHNDYHSAHPSSSIHNAAYPDSDYMPMAPTPDDNKLSSTSAPTMTGSSPSSSSYPTFQHTVQSHDGPNSSPAVFSPQQSNFQAAYRQETGANPWTPDSLSAVNPNLPPPPYDPTRARPPNSPLVVSNLGSPVSPGPNMYTPASPLSPHPSAPPSPSPSSHNGDSHALLANPTYIPLSRPQSAYSSQNPSASSSGPYRPGVPLYGRSASSLDKPGVTVLGPTALARRRRKRKLGICACALCLALLFLIALIVGIALGVLKIHRDDKEGNS